MRRVIFRDLDDVGKGGRKNGTMDERRKEEREDGTKGGTRCT